MRGTGHRRRTARREQAETPECPAPLVDQDRWGNAALLDWLGTKTGQEEQPGFSIQRAERIGESSDEEAYAIGLGDDGWRDYSESPDDTRMVHGGVAIDDHSLKAEAGLLYLSDDTLTMSSGASLQAGYWVDEDGNWNLGTQADFTGIGIETGNILGGDSETDPSLNFHLDLFSGGGGCRLGADGMSFGSSASAIDVGLSASTGQREDSPWDLALDANLSGGSVGEGFALNWDDADEDGVPEAGFAIELAALGGFGVDFRSEALGQLLNAVTW